MQKKQPHVYSELLHAFANQLLLVPPSFLGCGMVGKLSSKENNDKDGCGLHFLIHTKKTYTPQKLTWNPKSWWFVVVSPLPWGHFQAPCFFSGEYSTGQHFYGLNIPL